MRKALLLSICFLYYVNADAQWETVANAPTATRFDDASFINEHTGWIAQGNSLYKTSDGGSTWQLLSTLPISSNGYVRSVEFLNDSIGLYGTLASANNPAGVFRTTDGGLTFNSINILASSDDGMCGMAHFGNTVIAVGTWSSAVPHFYKSIDAGLNWTSYNLSSIATGLVDCYVFDDNNFLVCGTSAPDQKAFIARTSDGGATWQQVAYCSIATVSYMWKMFFLDNGVGFASVQNGPVIFKTTDYGFTWTEINLGLITATGLGAIGALNDSVIWAGNQFEHGMYGTTDGGQSWTFYSAFGHNMDRMVRLDSNHLLCVGSTVYKYTGSSNDVPIDSSLISQHHFVTVKPNPFINEMQVHMNLFQSSYILLDLVDGYGKIVKHLFAGTLPAGDHDKIFATPGITSGLYTLLFRSNEEFKSVKVVKN